MAGCNRALLMHHQSILLLSQFTWSWCGDCFVSKLGSLAPMHTANTDTTEALCQETGSHLDIGTCTRGLLLQLLLCGDVRVHQQASPHSVAIACISMGQAALLNVWVIRQLQEDSGTPPVCSSSHVVACLTWH